MLCTGNICRSPMAEGLLRERLARTGLLAQVHSAGLLYDGRAASEHGVDAMRARGIDIAAHASRRMTRELLASADLVIGMAREHVREAVVLERSVWPRAFTLKELVRRGELVGPRREDEPLEAWLARVHAGRTTQELMGSSPEDDVADPIGGTPQQYERTAAELEGLTDRLATLLGAGAAAPGGTR